MELPSGVATSASPDLPFIEVRREDERYPPLLREIHDPPGTLYVLGNIDALQQPQIAIVGSRRASIGALKLTQLLARQLCSATFSVCSGLARGVDGAAHRGALDAGGTTVAVIGTGVDIVYPRQHTALAQEILSHGCIVSEFPPGTPARPGHFPRRNRIISGLAAGVLVVEAAERSGSLITARLAMEQGREVFALPWSVLHEGGRGCLKLLRDGARMMLGVEDILEEVGHLASLSPGGGDSLRGLSGVEGMVGSGGDAKAEVNAASRVQAGEEAEQDHQPSSREGELLSLIGDRVCSVDELTEATGWAAHEVMAELSALEIVGAVHQAAGGYGRA